MKPKEGTFYLCNYGLIPNITKQFITGVTLPVDAGALARMPNAREENSVKWGYAS